MAVMMIDRKHIETAWSTSIYHGDDGYRSDRNTIWAKLRLVETRMVIGKHPIAYSIRIP
jgi:hypothetical protein